MNSLSSLNDELYAQVPKSLGCKTYLVFSPFSFRFLKQNSLFSEEQILSISNSSNIIFALLPKNVFIQTNKI